MGVQFDNVSPRIFKSSEMRSSKQTTFSGLLEWIVFSSRANLTFLRCLTSPPLQNGAEVAPTSPSSPHIDFLHLRIMKA